MTADGYKNRCGSFHTQANLSQTLSKILQQHYTAVNSVEGKPPPQMPNFVAEALHMICNNVAGVCNGNIVDPTSWHNISSYSQMVIDILSEQERLLREQAAKEE